MAGHSQFKNIMHRKGAQDAKRARMFAKITREIIVAARISPDATSNPRLRAALALARGANMPKDNIDRAIKKVVGGEDTTVYEEVRYEGYGPGGVAVIVECLTDNRNRTASEVRSAFSKSGGNLGETGSVAFMFERLGVLNFPLSLDFDSLFEAAVEGGADNVESTEENLQVTCSMDSFSVVRDYLSEKFPDQGEGKLEWRHTVGAPCDEETAKSLFKMIDILEDNDDVQNVYTNAEISHDILEKI
jgi:YebC/PmpR family DNA-binding regulatory protein